MIELIRNLFAFYGYEESAEQSLFLKHKDYPDYWIILPTDKLDIIDQKNLFERICKVYPDKEVDKNTSLLILLQIDSFDQSMQDIIIEWENNRYFFKKYILSYTPQDLDELLEELENKNVSEIESLLMRPQTFKALKDETTDNKAIGKYHLLYALSHKLPFLMTNVVLNENSDQLVNHFIPQGKMLSIYEWVCNLENHEEEYIENLVVSELNDGNK